MTLSRFPTVMPMAAEASIEVADALRHVRDATGDLTYRDLDRVQRGLANAKLTTAQALAEGSKQPAAAEAFMVSIGGPATLIDYQTAAKDAEAKAATWNAALAGVLSSLTADELIGLEQHGADSLSYKMIEHKHFIPAAKADPLRSSQALAELISAFEAVGAV